MRLYDVTDRAPDIDPDETPDDHWVEDNLESTDVEPGKIWFERGVGPIIMPRKASDLARPGWSAFIIAANLAGRWYLPEVGPVYP